MNKNDDYLWADETAEQIAAPKDHVTINKPNVAGEIAWGVICIVLGIGMTLGIALVSFAFYIGGAMIALMIVAKLWHAVFG